MILGIGVDLIEVARIRQAHERFGTRFLERLLRPEELAYCAGFQQPAPHWAARFAAKEAIAKAFGTGISASLGLPDMEVVRRESGQPLVVLHNKGLELLHAHGPASLHLSLSHTENYAVAMAIWETT